ncbi:MAG: tetratricopeptide repeat protein, partial [Planctomycetota bacterium]|nr:tetratricopeptide repeat protein [Planctomycetota bacterium]
QVARARTRRATGEVQALLARMASQTERGVSQEQIALAVRHPQPEVTALLMAEVERCAARLRGGHELTPGDFSVVGLACFATVERTDLAPDLCVDPLVGFVRAAEAEELQELRGLALGALCALRSPRARAMAARLLAEVDLERLPDSSRMAIGRLDLDDLPADDAGALLLRARARLQVTRRPADQRAALADLTRALELQADSVEALMLRGRLLSTLGDLGAAQRDLDRVAALSPETPGLDLARADLAAWRGDHAGALAAVERAVARAQPGDPVPLMTRAALRRQGDLAGAFKDAARACQVAPRDPRPHVLRADLLLDRGDPSAALEALTLATSLRQHTAPQVWVLSAQAHIDLGQLDRAAQALGRLPATARTDGRFLFVQARLHLARGDPAAARRSLDQAIQLAPEAAELYALRATTHGMQGDPAAAEADLDQALRRAAHPALHLERGVLRRLRGDLRGAIEDLDACVGLDPRYARGLAERARGRFEQGDLDGALEDAGRCLALGREDPQALNVRGQVRLARGEVEAGVADLERALELSPTASGQDKLRELIRRARERR